MNARKKIVRENGLFAPREPVEKRRHNTHVLTTSVGLQISTDLSFEEWERVGKQLSGIVDSSSWWLGDWLVFGKQNYSDRYRHAIQAAGLQYQTLRNYAWVARRFEQSRRRAKLSFQHHAEVASLPNHEQDRWLDEAERLNWTTKHLRAAIQSSVESSSGSQSVPAGRSQIEVPSGRLGQWRKAADRLGIGFNHWIIMILDRAAEEILYSEVTAVSAGRKNEESNKVSSFIT